MIPHIVKPRLHLPVMRGRIDRRMLVNFRREACESANRFKLEMLSEDGAARVRVAARVADEWPSGSAEFDSALLMRGIQHEWHRRGRMLCGPESCAP